MTKRYTENHKGMQYASKLFREIDQKNALQPFTVSMPCAITVEKNSSHPITIKELKKDVDRQLNQTNKKAK